MKTLSAKLLLSSLCIGMSFSNVQAIEIDKSKDVTIQEWQGDIKQFNKHDFDRWRHGSWIFGVREGHNGWWWVVGANWYYYPSPVHPYPDPYRPYNVETKTFPVPVTTSHIRFWYYCDASQNYYPYVSECISDWKKVEASNVLDNQSEDKSIHLNVLKASGYPLQLISGDKQNEADVHQLSIYSTQFDNIDFKSSNSRVVLHDLQRQVDVFHQSLSIRNYDAANLINNTELLQSRMTAQFNLLSNTMPASGQTPASVTFPESTTLSPLIITNENQELVSK